MNNLENEFSSRGIKQPGGWYIYPKSIAIEFVLECQKRGVVILGIDGFRYFPETRGIQPIMEHAIDFTDFDAPKVNDVYAESVRFLESRPDEMYFEIVCEDDVLNDLSK